ncbi:MAG: hypothetical protein CVT79_15805 [Alphaproteobacteria bacterium HGW-Alphaproteobacteria-18]|nr:MAG: hypothetical protein CVT79_15805 [Alphaproteobacteria bacterium HGW-Alphaproteobacteria-18]
MSRDRAAIFWLALALALSVFSVASGVEEVRYQRGELAKLIELDEADRNAELARQSDWGGAAYYAFHLTYDPPSDLSFAALGQRESAAWKHRIRMLSLEGQIHEADAPNPELALAGRIDFSFVAAYLAPLLVIFLLYDLRSGERAAGRMELLTATAGRAESPWRMRAAMRIGALAGCVLLPLGIGGSVMGAPVAGLLLMSMAVVLHVLVWWALVALADRLSVASTTQLSILVGGWLLLAVLVPATGRILVERAIPVPSGAEILLAQREAVNAAWDLPKEQTMIPFIERHPEWAEHSQIDAGFDWKWYYAFQQVGDQSAEDISAAYTRGRLKRDEAARLSAWLSPPAFLERYLQSLAGTDVRSVIAYEQSVRDFHAELRSFYYARLFPGQDFRIAEAAGLPEYSPAR